MYLHSECIIWCFVNTLCSHPTTQEGVEDLLVASTVVASETPEGICQKKADCPEKLICVDGECTESCCTFILIENNYFCNRKMLHTLRA